MAGHWTKEFSYSRGIVAAKGIFYFVLTNDELDEDDVPNSYFVVWSAGQWHDGGSTAWNTVALGRCTVPKDQAIGIGEYGQAYLLGKGDRHEEEVKAGKISPEDRGTLRAVCAIEGQAYAAGMDRQVYRRDGAKKWTCIDATMRPPEDSEESVGFEAIDGFSPTDVYAAGWKGEIWHYSGKAWKQIDSPTNRILTALCCAGDGYVYACGRLGLLLRGKGNRWKVIEHDSVTEDLWSLAWYKKKLYLSSLTQVYTLEGTKLKPVDFGEEVPESCYMLNAEAGVLLSTGADDVLLFDGKEWSRID